jgi:hypothetical protein
MALLENVVLGKDRFNSELLSLTTGDQAPTVRAAML